MAVAPPDVERAALELEPRLRAELAALLIRSLEDDHGIDAEEIERLWAAEIRERIRQIDAGEVELIPAEKVLADLRRRLEERKG